MTNPTEARSGTSAGRFDGTATAGENPAASILTRDEFKRELSVMEGHAAEWGRILDHDFELRRQLAAAQGEFARLMTERNEARAERDAAVDELHFKGYRPCDIPACNCPHWHGGQANQRLDEIFEAVAGEQPPGQMRPALHVVREVLAERDQLRAQAERLREVCYHVELERDGLRAHALRLEDTLRDHDCKTGQRPLVLSIARNMMNKRYGDVMVALTAERDALVARVKWLEGQLADTERVHNYEYVAAEQRLCRANDMLRRIEWLCNEGHRQGAPRAASEDILEELGLYFAKHQRAESKDRLAQLREAQARSASRFEASEDFDYSGKK